MFTIGLSAKPKKGRNESKEINTNSE